MNGIQKSKTRKSSYQKTPEKGFFYFKYLRYLLLWCFYHSKEMKIVKINESTIRKIVTRLLNEKVGVPDNIYEVAEKIYDGLVSGIHPNSTKDKLSRNTLWIDVEENINELYIDEVGINFELLDYDSIQPVAYQNVQKIRLDSDNMVMEYQAFDGIVRLNLVIAVPSDVTGADLINYFNEEKRDVVSTLAHELKHTYDHHKKGKVSVTDTAEYNVYSDLRFGIRTIDNFLQNLYFVTLVENVVRPSELYARIKYDEVDKNNFYDYFFNDDTIQALSNIKNYTFEKFINDLKDEYGNCVEFLKTGNVYDRFMSKNQVISEVLRIVYVNIVNAKVSKVVEYLGLDNVDPQIAQIEDLISKLTGKKSTLEDRNKYGKKYLERLKKYQGDIDEYYVKEIDYMSFVADKMLRKLSKLYSLIDEDTSSIKNFELYHKLYKKTKPKFTKEIKQYSFDKKKL